MKFWKTCGLVLGLGIGLCGTQHAAEAANAVGFMLPGEVSVDHARGDVTGDGVEDEIYLIGQDRTKDRLVTGMNIVVIDGKNGEIARSGFNSVSGEKGKLFIGDFNGDAVNDVMFALQMENGELGCFAAAFHGDAPSVIYESAQAAERGEVVLTEADQGKAFTVKKGAAIQLRLPESPSTGYTWQFNAFDAKALTFVGQQNFKPVEQNAMAGKPELKVFTLKAAETGVVTLDLSNYRVWEGAGSAARHFTATIQIVE